MSTYNLKICGQGSTVEVPANRLALGDSQVEQQSNFNHFPLLQWS
jgi:hypothetical protein